MLILRAYSQTTPCDRHDAGRGGPRLLPGCAGAHQIRCGQTGTGHRHRGHPTPRAWVSAIETAPWPAQPATTSAGGRRAPPGEHFRPGRRACQIRGLASATSPLGPAVRLATMSRGRSPLSRGRPPSTTGSAPGGIQAGPYRHQLAASRSVPAGPRMRCALSGQGPAGRHAGTECGAVVRRFLIDPGRIAGYLGAGAARPRRVKAPARQSGLGAEIWCSRNSAAVGAAPDRGRRPRAVENSGG